MLLIFLIKKRSSKNVEWLSGEGDFCNEYSKMEMLEAS